jgi:hypothetical protein
MPCISFTGLYGHSPHKLAPAGSYHRPEIRSRVAWTYSGECEGVWGEGGVCMRVVSCFGIGCTRVYAKGMEGVVCTLKEWKVETNLWPTRTSQLFGSKQVKGDELAQSNRLPQIRRRLHQWTLWAWSHTHTHPSLPRSLPGYMYAFTHTQGWPESYIFGVCTVFLAGKSPNIWSYTVYIYGSGQPYTYNISPTPWHLMHKFWLSRCLWHVCGM